ncbi:MAG: radical SAM protein [Phycisphaerae bacterium]
MNLKPINLDGAFNYVGVFLTFRCNYQCSYCINKHAGGVRTSKHLSADEWILGLNRLKLRTDLPLSLQGGEPTIHPGFYKIVTGIAKETNLDLLTNMQFDVDDFRHQVSPERIRRNAPYASIRVSFHPQVMNLEETMEKALGLQKLGYSIGLFGVLHPRQESIILDAQEKCRQAGLDFRTKDFLGFYNGQLYGEYLYPAALDGQRHSPVKCKNSELLIDPSGFIYRCHHDVYKGLNPIGHILDPELRIESKFRECQFFGNCNPCDIKVKNNRFQQFGHCAVEILRQEVGALLAVSS